MNAMHQHTDRMNHIRHWRRRRPRLLRRWVCATTLALVGMIAGCTAGPVSRPSGAAAQQQRNETTLRVMTFNIRYGTAPDSEDAWPHRRALAIRVIQDFEPH